MKLAMVAACLYVGVTGCEKPPHEAEPAPKAVATSASGPASHSAGIVLVPKASFGPIALGASKAQIDALGILKTHPQYSAMTIPYTVYYDANGRAKRVQLSLQYAPADVTIGAVTIPRTATMNEVKALLGDCVDGPLATGGMTSHCRQGTVNVQVGSGSPSEVWIEAALP